MITLLDYGAGNVRSVMNAIQTLGERIETAQCPEDILSAEKLIFPGVGAFGSMMRMLHEKNFISPLKAYLLSGRPFLGICLGMHALFEFGEESFGTPGIGLFKGRVERFKTDLAVPHIGWNGIQIRQPSRIFNGLSDDEKFYFVHSYHVVPTEPDVILTTTDYGYPFVSAVQRGNVIGTQYHPEKSGEAGLRLLKNFLDTSASPAQVSQQAGTTRLAKRIIACLDVRANDCNDLVVTKGDRYDVREQGGEVRNMGKPVELAQRYYEEGADEIVFLNITGFRDFPLQDMPMLEVLKQTSQNVFVPLTIGGGIRGFTDSMGRCYSALEVASEYFRSGADKVSIGSDAVAIVEDHLNGRSTGTSAIEEIANVYGSQAVVISIDPRRVYVSSPDAVPHKTVSTSLPGPGGEAYCWYQCTIKGGREGRPVDAITLASVCQKLGAGEILLNCIDRDGTNSGFDIELIEAVKNAVTIPVIASSGAGNTEHFYEVFTRTNADAALAAGIFHRGEVPIPSVKHYLRGKVEVRM